MFGLLYGQVLKSSGIINIYFSIYGNALEPGCMVIIFPPSLSLYNGLRNYLGCRSCIAHAQYFKYLTGIIEAMASYEPQRTSAYSDDLRWRNLRGTKSKVLRCCI